MDFLSLFVEGIEEKPRIEMKKENFDPVKVADDKIVVEDERKFKEYFLEEKDNAKAKIDIWWKIKKFSHQENVTNVDIERSINQEIIY